MRPVFTIALLWLSACGAPAPVVIDAPPEITHFSMLTLDEAGALDEATRVFVLGSEGTPVFAERGARQILVGWPKEDVGGDAAAGARVTPLLGCNAQWPEPRWRAEWSEDRLTPIGGALPLALGSPDLELCPAGELGAQQLVGLCLEQTCAATSRRLSACSWATDFSACGAGSGLVRRRPDGASCMRLDGCEPGLDSNGADIQICADGCEHAIIALPPELEADVDRIALLPAVPRASPTGELSPDDLRGGVAHDLVRLPDALWVSTSSAAGCAQNSDVVGRLHRLPLPDARPISTHAAPPCLGALAADGDAFIGIHREDDHWQLSRFDASGGRIQTAAMAADPGQPALHLDSTPSFVVVVESVIAGIFRTPGGADRLVVHARTDLTRMHTLDLDDAGYTAITVASEDEAIILGRADAPQILWMQPRSGSNLRKQGFVRRTPPDVSSLEVWALEWDDNLRALEVAVGDAGALHLHSTAGALGLVATTDPRDLPTAFGSSPIGDARMVALARPETNGPELSVATFDLGKQRWATLPKRLGPGLAKKGVTDPQGRTYFLLPWSAEVVRVAPR